ncbi:hypothetical protein [Paenibacillus harenae]|uniref:hypothetical protein n=1 Tax=Paenibacillus harenae TaxID=306543 RepID=UPI00040CBAC2|nr:hypothetical protein [Paenibacillus harenae]
MILEYRLAKSIMENEDGLNHLWIRLSGTDPYDRKRVQMNINMPDGLLRLPNLNGCSEDPAGKMELAQSDDILLEVYTEDQVACGVYMISVDISYLDVRNPLRMMLIAIPVRLVTEDEMDGVVIDDEVVNRLKQLKGKAASNETDEINVFGIRPISVKNEFSFLEQKYRIDY